LGYGVSSLIETTDTSFQALIGLPFWQWFYSPPEEVLKGTWVFKNGYYFYKETWLDGGSIL